MILTFQILECVKGKVVELTPLDFPLADAVKSLSLDTATAG